MQFLTNVNIDFMKQRKAATYISLALILIGIVSLIFHGGPQYGIDFLGGIELRLNFDKPVDIGIVRRALSNAGFKNSMIKELAGESETGSDVIVFVQQDATAPMSSLADSTAAKGDISLQIEKALETEFSDNPFRETSKNLVGPKIGGELRDAAIKAIFIALILILVYISWRFEFRFAVGAIAALFHDVLITLGVFSLLNLEITLAIVAAFLTIVGYSLNDTIVVFDRVRENMKVMRRESFFTILNQSINQSLSRTVITSVTTLFVVLFLYFFGGEVIKYFAFAMIIGVLVGTYSSIYIASPVVLAMYLRSEGNKNRKPQTDRRHSKKATAKSR